MDFNFAACNLCARSTVTYLEMVAYIRCVCDAFSEYKLMTACEQVKEAFVQRGAAMRELTIFMQTFADIADYIEQASAPTLDMLDISNITSNDLQNIR